MDSRDLAGDFPSDHREPQVPMRILLIEDDGMFGKALARGLNDNGITVDWTRNGVDGFAALKQSEYAAALIDIGLPQMSGLEVLKEVRQAGAKTPVLISPRATGPRT